MRNIKIISCFIAGISIIRGTIASPCKPSTISGSYVATITTTREPVSTSDGPSTTIDATTITAATTDTTLATVSESTTLATESLSTTEYLSTSAVPQPTDTFTLVAANSDQTDVNGETLKFKTNDPTILTLKPLPGTEDQFETGHFSLEPLTDRLMLGDSYVVYYQSIAEPLGTGPETSINFRYLTCASPPTVGQPLSCNRPSGSGFKWMTKIESDQKDLFLRSEQWWDNDLYSLVDMIVG